MRPHPMPFLAVLLLPLLPHAAQAAWPNASAVNLPVCRAAGAQASPRAVPDGAGGMIVVWADARLGVYDIYAQHVLASGSVDPAWPVDGRALCSATLDQFNPAVVSDSAGGAVVAWEDLRAGTGGRDVYAQHVLASGVVDPAWPVNGRALGTGAGTRISIDGCADGAGGALFVWADSRSGTFDIYSAHLRANGTLDPAGGANGNPVCAAVQNQTSPTIASDGAGGAIVAWMDARTYVSISVPYFTRLAPTGLAFGGWTANGIAATTNANPGYSPRACSDGAGGAIVAWEEVATTSRDIVVQHVVSGAANGSTDPAWPATGRLACNATYDQWAIDIVSDGAGGAFFTWHDGRVGSANNIYAHHILAGGAFDPGWTANGTAICTDPGGQGYPSICSDGGGGVYVGWHDARGGGSHLDIYVQHVSGAGAVDPLWPVNGRAISTATGDQLYVDLVADGSGGALAAWDDTRSGEVDVYAQRIARGGVLGTPEPVMAGVKDVPGDQGGNVRVAWAASWLDLAFDPALAAYDVYRSVPASAATQARARGALAVVRAGDPLPLDPSRLVVFPAASSTYAWEFVQTVPLNHFANTYGVTASTLGDSSAAGNPRTSFLVVARGTSPGLIWPSRPDSGYSVDNIAPLTPAPFAGVYAGGTSIMNWGAVTAGDLAGYRLYRGPNPSFTPGPGNLLATPDANVLHYSDAAGATYVYKLTAIDVHGNESAPATLIPTGALAVGDDAPHSLAFALAGANPSAHGAMLRLALPQAARVRVSVYDVGGRRVRELADAAYPAGRHDLRWDGTDATGARVADGLYFARLEAAGITRQVRLVTAR